ncbi:zinc metallopeptidase [Grosmannia clavigera kw1407]|uniref:Zinc metallopeptidase n=1 Tax=Grosmannia clavigera (strain kw1407 / UAMH 11150) TaxID=655863 RepID=F0X6L9_GROCL|nr:zinc metallopeptidase [Grosmannia clavigera kw1407]EFX06316.1 zinc metallopeptidase [Grosmannia clavigera kw1407]
MKLHNIVFPRREDSGAAGSSGPIARWDVELVDGVVRAIAPAASSDDSHANVASRLLLPPLCHPHLHLDKTYILTGGGCCGGRRPDSDDVDAEHAEPEPSYDDLLPQTGDFAEALRTTATAKARFTAADLRRRGAQLLATSWRQGVTAARVFVEVDAGAAGGGRVAMEVAMALQRDFAGRVAVQICAFAQEAVFSGEAGAANRAAMEAVLADPVLAPAVAALGSAPYVEASRALALQNLDWAVETALAHGLHLDLHLDYNLDDPASSGRMPLLYDLLDTLERRRWCARAASSVGASNPDRGSRMRTVAVGHVTQLTRLSAAQLSALAARIRQRGLPVHLVGLPTSDMYMMGRGATATPGTGVPRGTLNVPALLRHGLPACLGVNNVGNAFTPYGTGDPLLLACWGVGLYHAGTPADANRLYGAVSWGARAAIGEVEDERSEERQGMKRSKNSQDIDQSEEKSWWDVEPSQLLGRHIGPVLMLTNEHHVQMSDDDDDKTNGRPTLPPIPARARTGFRDVVWDPPDLSLRRIVG